MPEIRLRAPPQEVSPCGPGVTFDDDSFDIDIVYGLPTGGSHEVTPLIIEEVQPLRSPQIAARVSCAQDIYDQTLIQSEVKSVQWQAWFEANGMRCPDQYGLGFDRSSMSISVAVNRLGVVLESSLLAHNELIGRTAQRKSKSLRYVGHYLVQPKRNKKSASPDLFAGWLTQQLSNSAPAPIL